MGNQRLDHLLSKEFREVLVMLECLNVRMFELLKQIPKGETHANISSMAFSQETSNKLLNQSSLDRGEISSRFFVG